jgi:hypothetical protein
MSGHTTTAEANGPLEGLQTAPRGSTSPIQHSRVVDADGRSVACFSALEILVWQFVSNGVLPAEAVANELARYATFQPDAAQLLQVLARIARAAGSDSSEDPSAASEEAVSEHSHEIPK